MIIFNIKNFLKGGELLLSKTVFIDVKWNDSKLTLWSESPLCTNPPVHFVIFVHCCLTQKCIVFIHIPFIICCQLSLSETFKTFKLWIFVSLCASCHLHSFIIMFANNKGSRINIHHHHRSLTRLFSSVHCSIIRTGVWNNLHSSGVKIDSEFKF